MLLSCEQFPITPLLLLPPGSVEYAVRTDAGSRQPAPKPVGTTIAPQPDLLKGTADLLRAP
jgi:hypothetical protein